MIKETVNNCMSHYYYKKSYNYHLKYDTKGKPCGKGYIAAGLHCTVEEGIVGNPAWSESPSTKDFNNPERMKEHVISIFGNSSLNTDEDELSESRDIFLKRNPKMTKSIANKYMTGVTKAYIIADEKGEEVGQKYLDVHNEKYKKYFNPHQPKSKPVKPRSLTPRQMTELIAAGALLTSGALLWNYREQIKDRFSNRDPNYR